MNHTFKLDLNEHADLAPRAFAQARIGGLLASAASLSAMAFSLSQEDPLPAAVDWVQDGAFGPVEDQGRCGGCWSFAATATVSAAWKIASGQLVDLSKQQLMDCTVDFGNDGCGGGNMDNAYSFGQQAALCSAAGYRYQGNLGTCQTDCVVAIPLGGVLGYQRIEPLNEEALLQALVQQPVSVGIEAEESPQFQLYKSGIMSGMCGTLPNHAVVVVGYGSEDGNDYFLLRNSWGKSWGLDGYFKLLRGPGKTGVGECGILTMPSYPLVDAAVAPPPTPTPAASAQAPPAPAANASDAYGRAPCRADEQLVVVALSSGEEGHSCAPECSDGTPCPSPGSCVLRESSFLSMFFGRRFCAVPCREDASTCGGTGAVCASTAEGPGTCVFVNERSGNMRATKARVQQQQEEGEQEQEGGSAGSGVQQSAGRKLSDEAPLSDLFA